MKKSLGKGVTLTIEETRDLTAFLVDVQNLVEYMSDRFPGPKDQEVLRNFFYDSERIGMNIISKYKELRQEMDNKKPADIISINRGPLKIV